MKPISFFTVWAAILIMLNFTPCLAAPGEWQIIYEVSYQELNESPDPEKNVVIPKQTIVGLGESYFYTKNDWEKNVYDFAGRRIISLDNERKTYTAHSIFSHLAFQLHFFETRLSVSNIMHHETEKDKQLPNDKNYDPFEIETVFSLESGRETRTVTETAENDRVKYTVNGETVAEAVLSGEKLEYPYRDMWAKYLMYKHNVHPSIRRSIAAHGSIPRSITYRFTDSTTYLCSLRLKSLTRAETSEALIPNGYSLSYNARDDLSGIIHGLKTKKIGMPCLSKEQLLTASRNAYKKRKYLDSILILYELNYQTGEWPGKEMEKILSHAKTNRSMALFTDALYRKQPREKELALLDQINLNHLSRSYIIDIMKADIIKNHDFKTAESLYINALKSNPYLISIYIGLADTYRKHAEMAKAWDCWDLARSLDPMHPGLEHIKEYEKNILKNYAEFF